MAIITMTPDGIVRNGVGGTPFFDASRASLIGGGFKTTAWIDYLIGCSRDNYVFVTIKRTRLHVSFLPQHHSSFTTTKVQKVLDLLK